MAARKKESAVTFDDDDLLSALVSLTRYAPMKIATNPINILDRMTRRPLAVGQVLAGELQGTSLAQIS